MVKPRNFLIAAGILVATTLGAGIFALPYAFQKSGWLTGFFYLSVLSVSLIFIHYLYWLALAKIQEKERLLGLVKIYLGKNFFRLAFLSVIAGLLLILVAYLILAGKFIGLIFPETNLRFGILIFWALSSLPLILKLPRIVSFEFWGGVLMLILIFAIFFASGMSLKFYLPAIDFKNPFLAFGPILFSLAGWTAVEPIFDFGKKRDGFNPGAVLASGTLITALFYLIFVWAVFSSATRIAPDTISGLTDWSFWKMAALGWLGLFAIWTSYLPIGLEIKNSLEKDLKLNSVISLSVILFLPLLLLSLGFSNFFSLISLVGGVFLAIQYIFIILVSRKVLVLNRVRRILTDFLIWVFILAAIYEIYYFII